MPNVYPIDYPDSNPKIWVRKMTLDPVQMTSVNGAADTTETMFDMCIIPAGVIQAGSIMEITSMWAFTNNSATGTTKNFAHRISPTTGQAATDTSLITTSQTTNTSGTLTNFARFQAVDNLYLINGNGALGGALNTNAILNRTNSFAVDRGITFWSYWSAQQAVTQTITLYGWKVEIYR